MSDLVVKIRRMSPAGLADFRASGRVKAGTKRKILSTSLPSATPATLATPLSVNALYARTCVRVYRGSWGTCVANVAGVAEGFLASRADGRDTHEMALYEPSWPSASVRRCYIWGSVERSVPCRATAARLSGEHRRQISAPTGTVGRSRRTDEAPVGWREVLRSCCHDLSISLSISVVNSGSNLDNCLDRL
jgi:hypothetical protein